MDMTVLLFVFLEIAGLLIVGSWIGVGWTLLLLLGGFVLGLALIGRGGRAAMAAVNQTARSRQVGNTTVTGGFLTVVAGALLMIPGFITDVAALALLLPPIRTLVRRRTQAWAQRQSASIQVVNLVTCRSARGTAPRGHGWAAALRTTRWTGRSSR